MASNTGKAQIAICLMVSSKVLHHPRNSLTMYGKALSKTTRRTTPASDLRRAANFRLFGLDFWLRLRTTFARMIAQVRLFEAAGIDVSVDLRR
jgi:hypothetical protein